MITETGVPVQILSTLGDQRFVMTPCGRIGTVVGGEPLFDIQVVLDPGHGGPIDTGAVGPNGLVERDLNMDLSLATKAELEARGITVALTRTRDYATILATRAAFADALRADLMVSVHHNAPAGFPSELPGTEVFVQSDSPESRRLGEVLYATVVDALATAEGVAWTTAGDAGVLRVLSTEGEDAYGMIRRPATPTALIELGYLANASEAAYFATRRLHRAGVGGVGRCDRGLPGDRRGRVEVGWTSPGSSTPRRRRAKTSATTRSWSSGCRASLRRSS